MCVYSCESGADCGEWDAVKLLLLFVSVSKDVTRWSSCKHIHRNRTYNQKKNHWCQHFLRKLNSFKREYMQTFDSSVIAGILCFFSICWVRSQTVTNRKCLQNILKTCSKIIGVPLRSLTSYDQQQVKEKAYGYMRDSSHFLHPQFILQLPAASWKLPVPRWMLCKSGKNIIRASSRVPGEEKGELCALPGVWHTPNLGVNWLLGLLIIFFIHLSAMPINWFINTPF